MCCVVIIGHYPGQLTSYLTRLMDEERSTIRLMRTEYQVRIVNGRYLYNNEGAPSTAGSAPQFCNRLLPKNYKPVKLV
jgi:hypothetical protein